MLNNCHRTMIRIFSRLAAVAILSVAASATHAAPVLQTVYDSVDGFSATGSTDVTTTNWAAGKFTFPTLTNGYQLAAVKVQLSGVPAGSVELSVWSANVGSPGIPGNQLFTLTSPASLAAGLNTFTSTQSLPAGGTTYWIVMKGLAGTPNGAATWDRTTGTPNGPGASTEVALYTPGLGGRWNTQTPGDPLMMQIYAVPEPSTYAMGLAGLGFAGLGTLRRRRRTLSRG